MTTEGSHPVGSLGPRPLDVAQHQSPDWEGLLMGEQAWVISPVEEEESGVEDKEKRYGEGGEGEGKRERERGWQEGGVCEEETQEKGEG